MIQIRPKLHLVIVVFVITSLCDYAYARQELNPKTATGRELMQAVYDQHLRYPFIYEELSMVTHDRRGNKETKSLRFFSRAESVNDLKTAFAIRLSKGT